MAAIDIVFWVPVHRFDTTLDVYVSVLEAFVVPFAVLVALASVGFSLRRR